MMIKRILAIFLLLSCLFALAAVDFNLVLTKEGATEMGFYSDEKGTVPITRIGNMVSQDGSASAMGTFYVGYSISHDIMDVETDTFRILLTFSSSGNIENGDDWMLVHENGQIGLVFDYTINNIREGEGTTTSSATFVPTTRDEKAPLAGGLNGNGVDMAPRQIEIFNRLETDSIPVSNVHEVTITINPPQTTEDTNSGGFTTGQYRGYVVLSMEAVS